MKRYKEQRLFSLQVWVLLCFQSAKRTWLGRGDPLTNYNLIAGKKYWGQFSRVPESWLWGKGTHIYITRFNDVFSVMLQERLVIWECYITNILKYMREREVFLEPISSFKRQPVIQQFHLDNYLGRHFSFVNMVHFEV